MTTTTVLWILLVTLVGLEIYCHSLWRQTIKRGNLIREYVDQVFDLSKNNRAIKSECDKLAHMVELRDGQIDTLKRSLTEAEEKLAKFDRIRGEGGKFVRPDGTYTPYDTEEPEMVADAKTEVAEWNEKNIKVTEWDGDFAPNAENTGGISGTYTPPPTGTIED